MPSLIAQLREKYDTDSAIAAALGISRQAISQAARRGRLSESAAIAAASLLNLDPGAALLANATTTTNPPAPILNAAPDLPIQPPKTAPNIQIMRLLVTMIRSGNYCWQANQISVTRKNF